MVQNGSKTDHVEHLGALWFEMIQNATKTAQFGVSELPWARNYLKCNRNYPFGAHVSGRPWLEIDLKGYKMIPKLHLLAYLSCLGREMV